MVLPPPAQSPLIQAVPTLRSGGTLMIIGGSEATHRVLGAMERVGTTNFVGVAFRARLRSAIGSGPCRLWREAIPVDVVEELQRKWPPYSHGFVPWDSRDLASHSPPAYPQEAPSTGRVPADMVIARLS